MPGSRTRIPWRIWLQWMPGACLLRGAFALRRWVGNPLTPREAVRYYAARVDLRRVAHVPPIPQDFADLRAALRVLFGGEPGCAVAAYLRLHAWWQAQQEHTERV